MSAKAKQMRYSCVYKTEWESNYPWLQAVVNESQKARCKFCKKDFSVANQVSQNEHVLIACVGPLIMLFYLLGQTTCGD
jgi:hypothetical protein